MPEAREGRWLPLPGERLQRRGVQPLAREPETTGGRTSADGEVEPDFAASPLPGTGEESRGAIRSKGRPALVTSSGKAAGSSPPLRPTQDVQLSIASPQ